MVSPRRRVLRPPQAMSITETRHVQTLQRRRTQLEKERISLSRWMARLKRAFNAVDKHQRYVTRLERQIAILEQD